MKKTDIADALGSVDEKYIAESAPGKNKRKTVAIKWPAVVAAMIVAAIGITALFGTNTGLLVEVNAIYRAEYPEMAKFPTLADGYEPRDDDPYGLYVGSDLYNAWEESRRAHFPYYHASDALEEFFKSTTAEFLSGAGKENVVYSPVNVYMALAVLAEITDGSSRKQILDLIGVDTIEELREQAYAVWNANYFNDGAVTSILANSIWLDDDIEYNKETLKTVAENYYTSSFSGNMGSDNYNEALHAWLNEQTGGLLTDHVDDLKFSPRTVLAIASTIYYNAKWVNKFEKSDTFEGVFNSAKGKTSCEYMKQTLLNETYYWGNNFSAASMKIENGGKMLFILPDENVSVKELLTDAQAMELMFSPEKYPEKYENQSNPQIHFTMPKFDVSSKLDLIGGLKDLGVKDVFNSFKSDFSPIVDENVAIGKVEHTVRVVTDEDGVTATAYTIIMGLGWGGPSDEEVDFTLDRPFIFVLKGNDETPLFVGIVNDVR
ncbi:MAG: hypothetical protein J5832_01055 [Clostridia bacterium]|nr:hypothetical protein [Clostridia bacterium]